MKYYLLITEEEAKKITALYLNPVKNAELIKKIEAELDGPADIEAFKKIGENFIKAKEILRKNPKTSREELAEKTGCMLDMGGNIISFVPHKVTSNTHLEELTNFLKANSTLLDYSNNALDLSKSFPNEKVSNFIQSNIIQFLYPNILDTPIAPFMQKSPAMLYYDYEKDEIKMNLFAYVYRVYNPQQTNYPELNGKTPKETATNVLVSMLSHELGHKIEMGKNPLNNQIFGYLTNLNDYSSGGFTAFIRMKQEGIREALINLKSKNIPDDIISLNVLNQCLMFQETLKNKPISETAKLNMAKIFKGSPHEYTEYIITLLSSNKVKNNASLKTDLKDAVVNYNVKITEPFNIDSSFESLDPKDKEAMYTALKTTYKTPNAIEGFLKNNKVDLLSAKQITKKALATNVSTSVRSPRQKTN